MKTLLSVLAASLLAFPALASEESEGPAADVRAEFSGPSNIGQFRYHAYPDISAGQSASLSELLESKPTAAGTGRETVPTKSMEFYSYPAIGTESVGDAQQPSWTPSMERATPGESYGR